MAVGLEKLESAITQTNSTPATGHKDLGHKSNLHQTRYAFLANCAVPLSCCNVQHWCSIEPGQSTGFENEYRWLSGQI